MGYFTPTQRREWSPRFARQPEKGNIFFSRFCYSPASTVELVETPVFRRLLVKVFAQKIQSLAKVTVTYKSFRLEEGSKRRGAQQLVLFFSV